MKKTNLKKTLFGFKPELHWELIVGGTFILILVMAAYSVYLFMYAKQQLSMEVVIPVQPVASTETAKIFTSSEQMQVLFDVYKNRQTTYDTLLSGLFASAKKATTTSSSSIATSSKQ